MESISTNENLKRAIGVKGLTLAIVNITVGTGIFVLPAVVAQNLGTAAILAYLICGVLIALIALCFAEVGSRTSNSGGVYTYIETAFGPYAGFLANNIYWFGASVISDAALANALADTLKYFFPALGADWVRILFFLFAFGGIALLNIRSVKNGVRLIEIAAFGKLVPLLVVMIAGAAFISPHNLALSSVPKIGDVGTTSLLLFYAFMGMEAPLSNGGEIQNPKRTVPLSIGLGVVSVLILYIAIQLVTQGVLGKTIALHKDAPLAAVAGVPFGNAGFVLIIIVTVISMFGVLGGEILSVPRILFAGARDGLLPKVFAKVHPRFFTPHVAVAFYAALGFLFAAIGGFKQLAVIASASSLLIYLGIVLATLKLRKDTSNAPVAAFKVRGGPIIPILAICVVIWLLSNLSRAELIAFAIFVLVCSVLYLFLKFKKKRDGVEQTYPQDTV
jgi:APA family basic amino acid/polyamine antiporter